MIWVCIYDLLLNIYLFRTENFINIYYDTNSQVIVEKNYKIVSPKQKYIKMKPTDGLTNLTLEELHARKQRLKGTIIGLGLVMGVAVAIILYMVVKKGNYGLLAVGFTSFIALMPGVIALNNINEEIKARKAA